MTTTAAPLSSIRTTPSAEGRGNVRAAGAFYLLTFAVSIPALLLIGPVLNTPDYILGAGQDTQVLWGCLLDFVNALAGIGSAVAVYPIARRFGQSFALGFVLTRMVEAAVIVIGVVGLLTVVVLRQKNVGLTGADAAALSVAGEALVTARNWTFLLGPVVMAVFNAAMFATLLYRSRLVPRVIPTLGLVGAPILLTSSLLTFFGHNTLNSTGHMLATAPIAVWELSIGFYMLFRGFRPVPSTTV